MARSITARGAKFGQSRRTRGVACKYIGLIFLIPYFNFLTIACNFSNSLKKFKDSKIIDVYIHMYPLNIFY